MSQDNSAISNLRPIANFGSEPSTEDVLVLLGDAAADHQEHRQAVLHAEVLSFDAASLPTLKQHLLQFIEAHRDSNDPEVQIAVASAIRKVIAEASADDLNAVAVLLEPGSRSSLSLELELEVVKMIVRKLTANPSIVSALEPSLADQLNELACAYLNDRLFGREKYPAVAMNAILALVVMGSPHVNEFARQLGTLRTDWFKTMLRRRATKIAAEVRQRDADAADRLIEFADTLTASVQREEVDASVPAQ